MEHAVNGGLVVMYNNVPLALLYKSNGFKEAEYPDPFGLNTPEVGLTHNSEPMAVEAVVVANVAVL
jgi:hypothetical protein